VCRFLIFNLFTEQLAAIFKKIGWERLKKISTSWQLLKDTAKEYGRQINQEDFFEQVLLKQKQTHPTIRKMRYWVSCKLTIFTCI